MRKDSLFQLLVAVDIALALATIAAEFLFNSTLPPALREHVDAMFHNWSVAGVGLFILWLAMLIFSIIAWVGLLSFWWPARAFYLISWLGMAALLLFSGPSVMTAPGVTLDMFSQLTSGIVIGMMYFNDEVKQRFEDSGLVEATA